jgi:hypothetical protein
MRELKISFKVKELPFQAVSFDGDKKSLEIIAQNNSISVAVFYDYKDKPLELVSEVKLNDEIDIILLDYRIELYVNGKIADEEWPYGNRLFDDEKIASSVDISVSNYVPKVTKTPNIISTFENAEGWREGNGVFVGDCMPYRKNDEYHVLYLKDRHHHKSKWGMGAHQWEHISTKDFKVWNVHPMAVEITDKEEASICTGSWICDENREYLYYTIRRPMGKPALVARSVSEDGYHFEKDKNFGFVISDKYEGAITRDPKVFRGEDGLFHMILTTKLVCEDKGCLAHYVSTDMEKWEDFGEPIYIVPNSDHPECPDYFKYNGKFYLVFSIRGRARYLVSDKPFEDFVSVTDELIPCAGVPKCAEWGGRLIFTGFKPIDGYAGTMTFKGAIAKPNGELIFEEI